MDQETKDTEVKEDAKPQTEGEIKKETNHKDDFVSRDDMERALRDLNKFKAKTKELEDKIKTKETETLKKNQEWQRLAELKEQEAKDALEREEKLKTGIVYDKKFSAVERAALAIGLRDIDDLKSLDISDIEIEYTSTGRVNVIGADKFAERLKTIKPHWFGQKTNKVNTSSPEIELGDKISKKQIWDAEKKAKESGDYAPYKKILNLYQRQQFTK